MNFKSTALAALAVSSVAARAVAAPVYTLAPLTISGSTQVYAAAINDAGTITGTYVTGTVPAGFVQTRTKVQILPPPPGFSAVSPVAMNNQGQILAQACQNTGGCYALGYTGTKLNYMNFIGTEIQTTGSGFGITGLNSAGSWLDVTLSTGTGYQSAIETKQGTVVTALTPPGLSDVFAMSLNDAGTVAGTAELCVSYANGCPRVFTWTNGKVHLTRVPSAYALGRVAINKSGDLAGALTTPDGIANLFVYHGNKFALLIPRSTHHAAAMAAFNNRAMVAGITDGAQAGLQYAAVWTAKGVAALGAWPTTDAVTITAMNTSGTLLLNVSDPTTKTQSAYKATCTGC